MSTNESPEPSSGITQAELNVMLADTRRRTLEEAASLALQMYERNQHCPAGCKCADAVHVAAAIRGLM